MAIEDIHKVDAITDGPAPGPVRLIMMEAREWSLSKERLEQLENKVSAYYNFVVTGQLVDAMPSANGRKCVVELHCRFNPPQEFDGLFPQVRAQFANINIEFRVILSGGLAGDPTFLQVYP